MHAPSLTVCVGGAPLCRARAVSGGVRARAGDTPCPPPHATTPTSLRRQEDEEGEDERGNKRARLSDANVVRWRWAAGADGELRKESNTRFVRWSDGSLQLLLGDEVLDVKQIDVAGDHTYLFTRHQGMIQAQGQVCAQGG